MNQHKINRSYKTIPCKYFPNCYKGDQCTFSHGKEDLLKDGYNVNQFKDIINVSKKDDGPKENNSFILFIEEINRFIEIYKNKKYIGYNVSEKFWKKELKYFQGLNEYLENS